MEEIVQVEKVAPDEWPRVLETARTSILVSAPEVRQEVIDRLFEIEEPLDVMVLTSRDQIETLDTCIRRRLKQLRDINFNIEIRLDDRDPPAGIALDDSTWVVPSTDGEPLSEDRARALLADLQERWTEAVEWPVPDQVEPDLRKHPDDEDYKE